ncbi:major facilitator superfamily transporter [Tritrichomonas foetus]|uniref:Major facilitator superfamily transporter n=1 Tax=Tritrichomonas foetus TaxID=1144522 RepID=A0A1J4JT85_9EUKA|nr:major facilitator superfamily transporter [Tritrichomonas foetus]|eukprot:OHT00734.1 major facilitator superfamily transporter [Tritrichomonas foetus]
MIDEPLIENKWIPLNQRDRLSYLHIMGIGLGNLAPHLLFVIIPTLFTPIAQSLKVSSLAQTFTLFYGSFAGFACAPLVGVYSDACTFRWGRRRIFIVTGSVFMTLGLLLMTYCVDIGKFLSGDKDPLRAQQALFIISYMATVTAGNIANAPTRTICSDVCPPKQQSLMANICSVFSALGGITVNTFGGFKIYSYTSLGQEQFLLIVSSVLIAFSITVTAIVAKEEPLTVKPPKVRPFKRIFDAIRTMPKPFSRTAIPYLLAQMALFQFNFGFSNFMGSDIFGGDNSAPEGSEAKKAYQNGLSWAMMCNVAKFGTQFLYGFVNHKVCELIGMKATSVAGYITLSAGLITFFWVNNQYPYLAISILVGAGYAVAMSVPYAIVSLVSPQQELGAYLGILMMCTVIGEQLSNFGIGQGFGLIWPNCPRKMIGISCAFGFIAAILSFWTIEPKVPNKSEYQSINEISATEETK